MTDEERKKHKYHPVSEIVRAFKTFSTKKLMNSLVQREVLSGKRTITTGLFVRKRN